MSPRNHDNPHETPIQLYPKPKEHWGRGKDVWSILDNVGMPQGHITINKQRLKDKHGQWSNNNNEECTNNARTTHDSTR